VASIYKRGRVWYSTIRIGGRRIRKPLDTDRKLAEAKLADLIKDRANDRYGVGQRSLSWAQWKEKFLAVSRGKPINTHKRDLAAIAALEAAFPITQLEHLTPELLESFKAKRLAAGKKPGTVNRERGALVAMARKASLWGHMPEHKWHLVKRARVVRNKVPAFFTVEDLGKLQLALPVETRLMWETALALGFDAGKRPAEIYYTAVSDVDFKAGVVWVRAHRDEGFIPKDHEERAIPMSADLRRVLRRQIDSLPRGCRWVLGPGRPSTVGSMSTFFGLKIVRKVGLTGNINKLRHSFGSYLAMADTNLLKIRDLMGHSSVKTTEIYAGLLPSSLAEAIHKGLPQGKFKGL
jgi:integrase